LIIRLDVDRNCNYNKLQSKRKFHQKKVFPHILNI